MYFIYFTDGYTLSYYKESTDGGMFERVSTPGEATRFHSYAAALGEVEELKDWVNSEGVGAAKFK